MVTLVMVLSDLTHSAATPKAVRSEIAASALMQARLNRVSLPQLIQQVSHLRQNQFRHGQLNRLGGPRHREDELAVRNPPARPAEHGAAADLLPTQCAEQFAKAGEG